TGACAGEPDLAAQRAVAAGVVRLRAAVHVHAGDHQARNRIVAQRGDLVRLHVRDGLRGLPAHLPDRERADMSTGLLVQYIVLGLIVVASVLVLIRKLAPQLSNRWLAAWSIRLARRDSRFSKALARRLQPKQATGNCADGCSTCGACGPKKPAAATPAQRDPGASGQARVAMESMPLRFRARH